MTEAAETATTMSPMNSVDMTGESVPSPRRRRARSLVIVVVLLAALVVAALLVPTPYYAFQPGSVTPTEPNIEISGAPTFASKGNINFLTVSVQRATAAKWIESRFVDGIEIISREEAFPSGDSKKEEAINQRAMDDSKVVASVVALERLGYTVARSGDGGFIESVGRGTPADQAGLTRGDVIVAIDGKKVTVVDEVTAALGANSIGATVTLEVVSQKGVQRSVPVTLVENPKKPGAPFLGVALTTANERVDLPFDIKIDSGRVTGPSAGFAWTLGVIDRLVKTDLTDGKRVAVTGTIDPTGQVGPIGGITQKIRAAIDAGASLFLYPASTTAKEVSEVKAIAKGHITIRAVDTVDDAIKILAPGGLPQPGAGS